MCLYAYKFHRTDWSRFQNEKKKTTYSTPTTMQTKYNCEMRICGCARVEKTSIHSPSCCFSGWMRAFNGTWDDVQGVGLAVAGGGLIVASQLKIQMSVDKLSVNEWINMAGDLSARGHADPFRCMRRLFIWMGNSFQCSHAMHSTIGMSLIMAVSDVSSQDWITMIRCVLNNFVFSCRNDIRTSVPEAAHPINHTQLN